MLKDLIKTLHAGASPDELKQRFKDVLEGVGPTEVAQIEEELIAEGGSREEVQRLCDLISQMRKGLKERRGYCDGQRGITHDIWLPAFGSASPASVGRQQLWESV